MTDISELANKIANLETRIAFQDDIIEDLNKTITGQWDEFDKLRRQISRLNAQISDLQSTGEISDNGEPPPPHY